jgi:hypothetical protein
MQLSCLMASGVSRLNAKLSKNAAQFLKCAMMPRE